MVETDANLFGSQVHATRVEAVKYLEDGGIVSLGQILFDDYISDRSQVKSCFVFFERFVVKTIELIRLARWLMRQLEVELAKECVVFQYRIRNLALFVKYFA